MPPQLQPPAGIDPVEQVAADVVGVGVGVADAVAVAVGVADAVDVGDAVVCALFAAAPETVGVGEPDVPGTADPEAVGEAVAFNAEVLDVAEGSGLAAIAGFEVTLSRRSTRCVCFFSILYSVSGLQVVDRLSAGDSTFISETVASAAPAVAEAAPILNSSSAFFIS